MGSESGQSQRRGAIIALTLFIALATLTEALFPAIVEAKPNHGHRIHA